MTKGERIKSAREAAGFTQEQLGRMCHTTKQTIYKYETGIVTNIPIDRLVAIAQALNVSAKYLAGWDDELLYSAAKDAILAQEFNALSEVERIAALNSVKEKTAIPKDDGLSPLDARLNELLAQASEETKQAMIVLLEQHQKP